MDLIIILKKIDFENQSTSININSHTMSNTRTNKSNLNIEKNKFDLEKKIHLNEYKTNTMSSS